VIFEERSEPKVVMGLPGFASNDVLHLLPFMREAAVKAASYLLANCGKNTA
jgi:hypothetical protein